MPKLLSTEQMAEFANSGYLFFEGIIDKDINREFLNDIGHTNIDDVDNIQKHFQNIKSSSSIPRIPAGTPLEDAYPLSSPLNKIFTNEIDKKAFVRDVDYLGFKKFNYKDMKFLIVIKHLCYDLSWLLKCSHNIQYEFLSSYLCNEYRLKSSVNNSFKTDIYDPKLIIEYLNYKKNENY